MDTQSIQEHYDVLSPYYAAIWDQHIHHGYFATGNESRAEATDNLIRLLLQQTELAPGSRVLDIGCGIGATSILFAAEFDHDVLGISISPEQIRLARQASAHLSKPPRFEVQDANNLQVDGPFDLIWSVEMISHLHDRSGFFAQGSRALGANGYWCIAAWLKESDLATDQETKYIRPIEEGMLVDLPTKEEYLQHFRDNGLRLSYYRDISKEVARTWDISLGLVGRPQLWQLARRHGGEFVQFLHAFKAMQAGFRSGCFRYAAIVITKPEGDAADDTTTPAL